MRREARTEGCCTKPTPSQSHDMFPPYAPVVKVELYDADLLNYAVDLGHSLDRQFGLPPKITASQRDVPGLTRAAVPLLADRGVKAISGGAAHYRVRWEGGFPAARNLLSRCGGFHPVVSLKDLASCSCSGSQRGVGTARRAFQHPLHLARPPHRQAALRLLAPWRLLGFAGGCKRRVCAGGKASLDPGLPISGRQVCL